MSLTNLLLAVYMTMAPVDDTTAVDTSSVSKPLFEVEMLYFDKQTGKLDTITPILPDTSTLDGRFEALTGKLKDDLESMGGDLGNSRYRFAEHDGSLYMFKTEKSTSEKALTIVSKYNLKTNEFGKLQFSGDESFYTTQPDTLDFVMSEDENSIKDIKESLDIIYKNGPVFIIYTDGFVGQIERSEKNPPRY